MFNLEFKDFVVNKYKTMKLFKEGLAPVQNYEGLWGFINKRGKEVIPCQYSGCRYFHEGLAAVQNHEGLWGYINMSGELVIPFKYEFVLNFWSGIAIVIKSMEPRIEAYIDANGNELKIANASPVCENNTQEKITPDMLMELLFPNSEDEEKKKQAQQREELLPGKIMVGLFDFNRYGMAIVKYYDIYKKKEFYAYINKDFEVIEMNLVISNFDSNGILVFKKEMENNLNLLNTNFQKVKDIVGIDKYSVELSHPLGASNAMPICIIGKKLTVNNKDKEVYAYACITEENELRLFTSFIYESARGFRENVGIVEVGEDLIGFVDLKGRDKLFCKKTEYTEIRDFSEGLAAVQNVNGLWGFINKKGEEVIRCRFRSHTHSGDPAVSKFSEGLSHVTGNDGLSYYIDKKGNKKLELYTYHSYLELPNRTIIIKADSEEELNKKKVETLSLAKQEILSFVDSQIDQTAYAIPTPIKKERKRS